ncbi:hypothetical protein R1sor_020288 [Riccia sorocarpa]|uniref:Uncharacterized protein n=1 Tax=Riccia sorocarpa TaxID=122646 RepID=A0ABD3IJ73_9MARC
MLLSIEQVFSQIGTPRIMVNTRLPIPPSLETNPSVYSATTSCSACYFVCGIYGERAHLQFVRLSSNLNKFSHLLVDQTKRDYVFLHRCPRKRNRQSSTSGVVKTTDQKSRSSSESLESSETPSRLLRSRTLREVAGQSTNEETTQAKENGSSKLLRSHLKATTSTAKGFSGPGSPEDKTGVQQDEDVGRQVRRRRMRRKSGASSHVDEKERIKRRVKNLVNRIRLEQNFIEAYAGEGWKGQSREKIRPEKELERAENQILRCKLSVRENIHELDKLALEGTLQQSAFDEEGRIYHEEVSLYTGPPRLEEVRSGQGFYSGLDLLPF